MAGLWARPVAGEKSDMNIDPGQSVRRWRVRRAGHQGGLATTEGKGVA